MNADELASGPDLLHRLGMLFPTVVNEADNILYGILVVLAKNSIEIRGESSSGKNAIGSAIQSAYPDGWIKDFTALTSKALRHLPNHIRGVYVREKRALKTGGANEESDAEYDVKMAISEGCIKMWIPTRDQSSETGWTTVEKKVVVDSFILTTTAEAAPEEYENRLHLTRARDDSGQSQKVVEFQLKQAEKPIWYRTVVDTNELNVAREVLTMAEKAPPAMIPYATLLEDAFTYDKPAVRRNAQKLLGLIDACAKIHHKQRASIVGPNGEVSLIAYPEDLYMVLSVGRIALPQTMRLLSQPMVDTLVRCLEIANKGDDITVRGVMLELESKDLKASQPTVYKRLKTLEQRGYLARRGERDDKNALLYDLVGNRVDSPFAILDTNEKRLEIEERFESFLEGVGKTTEVTRARTYIDPTTGEEKPVAPPVSMVLRTPAEPNSGSSALSEECALVSRHEEVKS